MMRQTRSVLLVWTACYSAAKAVDESRLGQRQPLAESISAPRAHRHRLNLLGELRCGACCRRHAQGGSRAALA